MSSVQIASPKVAGDCSQPAKWNARQTRDHDQKERTVAIRSQKVVSYAKDRPSPRPLFESRPVFFVTSRHHGKRSYHSHEWRIHTIKFIAVKLPVADSSHQVPRFIERRAVYMSAIRQPIQCESRGKYTPRIVPSVVDSKSNPKTQSCCVVVENIPCV